MGRTIRLWTWDAGVREVDVDADATYLVPIVQTILEGGLWKQFRKVPVDVLARLLPQLTVPAHTRRLLEIWIEEAPHRAA